MKFRTETGSCYEVDHTRKLIRRVTGTAPQTKVGVGDWREFQEITAIQPGYQVMVTWGFTGDPQDPQCIRHTTVTSLVMSVDALD